MPGGQASSSELAVGQRLQQPQLGAVAATIATASSTRAGAAGQARGAGQHGVADAGRDRPRRRRQRLGHVERVAGRRARAAPRSRAAGEARDGVERQRRGRQPRAAARAARRARAAAGGRGQPVVAVGGDHERGQRLDPAASSRTRSSVASSAQCRSSSTTTRGRRRAQLLRERAERVALVLAEDVAQRPQRPRRVERVAGAGQDPAFDPRAERAHERRLADPGLAGDEHERTTTRRDDALQRPLQFSQLIRPLE